MTGAPIAEYLATLSAETRRQRVYLWGKPHIVTPRLISTVFGDGGMILLLQPLATRPDRYVLRIDSSTDLESDRFYDFLDRLYDAVEDDFGPAEWEDDRGRQRHSYWPALNLSCGCSWAERGVFPIPSAPDRDPENPKRIY